MSTRSLAGQVRRAPHGATKPDIALPAFPSEPSFNPPASRTLQRPGTLWPVFRQRSIGLVRPLLWGRQRVGGNRSGGEDDGDEAVVEDEEKSLNDEKQTSHTGLLRRHQRSVTKYSITYLYFMSSK